MLNDYEIKKLNKILKERVRKYSSFPRKHIHTFIFIGATRQKICFECSGCHCTSYLDYDKESDLFDKVILSYILRDSYLSKSYVDRNYLTKDEVDSHYICRYIVNDLIDYVKGVVDDA